MKPTTLSDVTTNAANVISTIFQGAICADVRFFIEKDFKDSRPLSVIEVMAMVYILSPSRESIFTTSMSDCLATSTVQKEKKQSKNGSLTGSECFMLGSIPCYHIQND